MGRQLIDTFFPDLKNSKIDWLFKQKARRTSSGIVLGLAKKLGSLEQVLTGLDCVVIISHDTWLYLPIHSRYRLLHHELKHFRYDFEKDKIVLRNHTIQEFVETVAVFGTEGDEQHAFVKAANAYNQENSVF